LICYVSRGGYDSFENVNSPASTAFTFLADIPFANEIWSKWEPAASFAAESGDFAFTIFHVWPGIYDIQLLERALSLWHVTWGVSETQPELISTCYGKYSIEKDGRRVFCNTPKTAKCYAKGLIATRLPHLVEGAEVSALLPAAEEQFSDVWFQIAGCDLPLSLVCSLCARHLGDRHQASVYARGELIDNLNPLKQTFAHMALAVCDSVPAKTEEQHDEYS
jgi:hypothetical protein